METDPFAGVKVNLTGTLSIMMQYAQRITDLDLVAVQLVGRNNRTLLTKLATRDATIRPQAPHIPQIVADVIASARAVLIENGSQHALLNPRDPFGNGMQACAAIPLLADTQAVGVIYGMTVAPHSFTPAELSILQATAESVLSIVGSAEHAKMRSQDAGYYETEVGRLRAEMKNLEASSGWRLLRRIAAELTHAPDIEQLVERGLQIMIDLCDARRGSVMLVDTHGSLVCSAILKENDTYTTLTQGERATAESLMQQFLHGEGLAGWAMKHRRTIMTRDATQDARWLTGNAPADRERRAMVVVPLVVGNQAMGVVNLSHPEVGHFTSRQVILLEAIGSIMGTMVDGIRRSATRVTLVEQTQQALAELRDELTRLRAAFTAIDEGMMILDRQGRLLFMNPSAETMLGSPANFLQGHTFNDLLESTLSVERRELLVQLDSSVRAQIDPAVEQTIPLQQLQFGDRPYTLLVHPVHETDRTLLGVIVTLRDITLELPIIQAETELTSNVTHALRTPLTSIKGYTDLLLLGAVGEINEQQRDFLKRVETNTDRLNQLITDLTDLSRIENRILQLQLEDVDVVSLVHEVLEERQAELISHGIENKLTMPLDLPPVRADRERFRQMLNQLLTNAVNYTEPNGRIGISTRIDNNYVVVSVWDSGIGIASEDLARAGTKFFRADHPYVSRVPGFGLGLALVRGLAELQGGRLTITSTMNVGTIVSLTLPISPVLPADEYIPDGEAQAAGLE